MSTADRVRAIIERLLPTSAAPVDAETLGDRGADYVDLVAIELELGEAFGIRFPAGGELDEVDTVAQMIATVEHLVASRVDQVRL